MTTHDNHLEAGTIFNLVEAELIELKSLNGFRVKKSLISQLGVDEAYVYFNEPECLFVIYPSEQESVGPWKFLQKVSPEKRTIKISRSFKEIVKAGPLEYIRVGVFRHPKKYNIIIAVGDKHGSGK